MVCPLSLVLSPWFLSVSVCNYPIVSRKHCFIIIIRCLWVPQLFIPSLLWWSLRLRMDLIWIFPLGVNTLQSLALCSVTRYESLCWLSSTVKTPFSSEAWDMHEYVGVIRHQEELVWNYVNFSTVKPSGSLLRPVTFLPVSSWPC